ncbi:MAG: hypothetical protein ACK47B_26000 [Armatimonadota bacterium]
MRIGPLRSVNPDAIVAPQGYRVEALVTGLTFPSAISFGPGGELYLAEAGGVAGSVVAPPRVLRIDPDRSVTEIGRLENPILGLVYRNGELLIGEDGPSPRVLRVTAEGEVEVLVEGLPGGGDYGLSGLSLDASGALIFGVGVRTNSGVVGLDNAARGWVAAHPDWADVPGADVRLNGINYVTGQPTAGGSARRTTGSFKPFGIRCEAGEQVRGAARCGGAIYRLAADTAEPERVAWGLRNPVGVCCGPDGQIMATEGGMEERGSRPIAGAPDNLWEIQNGGYYGWPDHASGIAVTEPRFRLPGHPQPRQLLQDAPKVAGTPLATFAPRSGVGRFSVSSSEEFGFVGEALVALSGEWSAAAYPGDDAPHGHRVVRVNLRTGDTADFLVNRQGGPSSAGNSGGLERPFDVQFDPTGEVLYVVDMGEVRLNREHGLEPFGGTGIVWRITRIRETLTVTEKPERARRGDRRRGQPTEEAEAAEAVTAEETGAELAEEAEVTEETEVTEAAEAAEDQVQDEVTSAEAGGEVQVVEESAEPDQGEEEPAAPETAEEAAGEEPAAEAAPAEAEVPEAEAAPAEEAAAPAEEETVLSPEELSGESQPPAGEAEPTTAEPASEPADAEASEAPAEEQSEPASGEETERATE